MTITSRHKKAIKNVGKYRTEQELFESAHYSSSYAKSGNVKRTKGWQELMNKHLPDKKLLKVHEEGLNAFKEENKVVEHDEEGKPIYENVKSPDFSTRHKYLETGYKIKGKLSENKMLVDGNLILQAPQEAIDLINKINNEKGN